ncbi:helix-turn-helix domain-containing protein [Streptomyces sp. Wb2n-11]|uniref:MmyB family transcriptional regulator n=1 Tax=Streptomyces sp. Wb2n-11 TaxID=1030533 RepID=UPI000B2108CA|nr:helix-turn-helix domain-containing protein [Streptomyces sp. Wb2n-11]
MDKQALKDLLEGRRGLINPEHYGFVRADQRGRRTPGLSQHQVDQLINRSPGSCYRLENGRWKNPPDQVLRDVALLYGLDEQDWVSLYRYAGKGDPPGPLYPRSGKEVPGAWQRALDGMVDMAYVTDCSWEVVAHNAPCQQMFPSGVVPQNTMRWMLLSSEARQILLDWEHAWAPFVLPQLRAAIAARPDDPILHGIEADVLADPVTRKIYESGVPYIHPDGDERPLYHARKGPGWVTMCAAQPMAAPGSRLIILIFRAGEQRLHLRPPVLRAH